MCCSSRSPLDTLEATFRLLAGGPQPLAVDGRTVGLQASPSGCWTCERWCSIRRPASAYSVLCSWSLSGGPASIAGPGSLASLASCCQACRGRRQAPHTGLPRRRR